MNSKCQIGRESHLQNHGHTQASQAKNMWCQGQFVYIENCMGKSPIVKKMCN